MCDNVSTNMRCATTFAFLLFMTAAAAGCGGLVEDEAAGSTGATPLRRLPDAAKELVIVDPSVIEAPVETTFDPSRPAGNDRRGAWSFGRAIHNMLPAAQRGDARAASAFVDAWLVQWMSDQSPNPTVSASTARTNIELIVTRPWRVASGCAADDASCVLDMAKAPFRLVAIVNRPDLRIVANDGSAIGGEGRFVFQLVSPTIGRNVAGGPIEIIDPTPRPQKFTVIFEYSLPVADTTDTLKWASRWHELGSLPFGEEYNGALRNITNDFSGADRDARRPNGNALNQIRTNEVATQGARRFGAEAPLSVPQIWELREFRLSAATGRLAQHTVNLEPSRDFDIARSAFALPMGTRSTELASWLLANEDAILASRQVMPASMLGNSSLVGSPPFGAWGKASNSGSHSLVTADDPAVRVGDRVRDEFALDTCAGCHRHESTTPTPHFMHLSDRRAIDAGDQTTLGLAAPANDAEARATILSKMLQADIASDGGRYRDFVTLLATKPRDVKEKPGRKACR
jgi:hypothetical protein